MNQSPKPVTKQRIFLLLDESDQQRKSDEQRESAQVEPIHSTAAGSESSDGGASGCLWI